MSDATMNQFTAAENGWSFGNDDLPPVPIEIDLPFVGKVQIGEANGGLCGGLCAAALDYFFAGRKPPGWSKTPQENAAIVDYLWQRQLDSLNLPWGVVDFMRHMAGAQRLGAGIEDVRDAMGGNVGKLFKQVGGPQDPCVLGLVYRRSLDPAALVECHQVVAYDIAGSQILVYDPDFPGETWALAWDNETWQERKVGSPLADFYFVHSFFVIPYQRREPPA